jgi:hypothetical protein
MGCYVRNLMGILLHWSPSTSSISPWDAYSTSHNLDGRLWIVKGHHQNDLDLEVLVEGKDKQDLHLTR